MEEYLSQLNRQQLEAVKYTDGPSLVIAGAGSGKTRVLTYKIVHLLHLGYEPWRLLALTFTNKAAREMRSRIEQLVGQKTAGHLWMGTFHSIFARILRRHAERIGFKSNYTIYDTADSKSLVKTIIRDMDLDDKIYKPNTVVSAISTAKNALVSPERYATLADVMENDRRSRRPRLHEIYRIYRNRCFAANAMDFDDLLYYTNLLLRDNPDILSHYQEYFSYVMVDEYQDTNFAQHVIVSQLCNRHHNLCVVGDDAQSIYSFRGANIHNILNLKKAYPELKMFKLEQNYRSTQNIINAANSLISKNTEQIPKTVFSKNAPGEPIEVIRSYSDFEEGYLVANKISQLKMQTKDSYEDFAILYRTNAQSRVLEESLRKRNIPYRIYGGLSFYQRKEVKDALAYFRLAVNPKDDEALKRIINFPARGIGETTLNKIMRAAIENNVSAWEVISNPEKYPSGINAGTARKLEGFRELIGKFVEKNEAGATAEEMAKLIISKTQLLSMLMTDHTPESISKQENLQELLNGVAEFCATKMEEGLGETSLEAFLGEVLLATDQDSDDEEQAERVTMMTVHAAKGLEFNNVIIVGVEEDLFPSAMAKNSLSEVEEERRLLYVAITRAKKHCVMTYAASRYRNGATAICNPSRFIRDIDPDLLNLTGSASEMPRPSFADYRQSYHSTVNVGSRNNGTLPGPRWQRIEETGGSGEVPNYTDAKGFGTHPSKELREGMKIEHNRFGTGVIKVIDTGRTDHRITVTFENTGDRVLLLKFARFKILK